MVAQTDTSLGLGNLFTDDDKAKYFRTGHPDLASFHHALYRGMGMHGDKQGFWCVVACMLLNCLGRFL